MVELFADSGDPDQMSHSAMSDLSLHYLPVTCLGVSSLQWVKVSITTATDNIFLKNNKKYYCGK